jgi:hypothetical protein
MTKNVVLLTSLLFTGVVHSVQAQTFKVGDYVDVNTGGAWAPCTVSQTVLYSGKVGGYMAFCGPNEVGTFALTDVRARAATAEDKRVEAETAAALARQPKGNSVGAQYGTRDPATCANRTAPTKGAPSAEQARQYFICDHEGDAQTFLSLIANVKVQVAPVSHPPDPRASYATAPDLNQPAWDIRGSFTQYSCYKLSTMSNAFGRTHNCSVTDMPTATGYCYKNNFGDWHCPMWDLPHVLAKGLTNQLPPAGN